jgi:hypothetical protein
MHVRCPDRLPEDVYRQVLEQLAELSPVVQALPPTAALVELKGSLRYHGVDGRRLGEVLRVRTISRLGVDVRVGIGPSRSRQVRGFLKTSDRELAGHLRSKRRLCSRLRQQGSHGLCSGGCSEGSGLPSCEASPGRWAAVSSPSGVDSRMFSLSVSAIILSRPESVLDVQQGRRKPCDLLL